MKILCMIIGFIMILGFEVKSGGNKSLSIRMMFFALFYVIVAAFLIAFPLYLEFWR